MKSILRALALTGILGAAAGAAQAQVGIYVGARVPYASVEVAAPPCPGPGYFWTAGYYDGPAWVPGRWIYRGYDRDAYARGYDREHYRVYDRDEYRRYDRDGYRGDRHDDFRGRDRR